MDLNQSVFNSRYKLDLNIFKFLVSTNAIYINYINPTTGQTLLHDAAMRSNIEHLTYLLENGINIEVADKEGQTALHWACCQSLPKIVEKLLEHGADICAIDNDDLYPLHYAVKFSHLSYVKSFFSRARNAGCEVSFCNSQDKGGWTPLHYASKFGNYKMVNFLLEHGANVFLTDISNKLAYDVAHDDNIKNMLHTAMEQENKKAEAERKALQESAEEARLVEQKAFEEATKKALEEEKAEAERKALQESAEEVRLVEQKAFEKATTKALEESEQTVKVPCIKVVNMEGCPTFLNIPKGNADTGDDNMIKLTITLKGQTAIVAKALKALRQIDSSN